MDNYFFDSDFLYAKNIEEDYNNIKVLEFYSSKQFKEDSKLYLSNFVLTELITVLSKKENQKVALQVLSKFKNWHRLIDLSKNQYEDTLNLFELQKNKNISFVDCSNVILAREYGAKVLSFDKFYDKFKIRAKV